MNKFFGNRAVSVFEHGMAPFGVFEARYVENISMIKFENSFLFDFQTFKIETLFVAYIQNVQNSRQQILNQIGIFHIDE